MKRRTLLTGGADRMIRRWDASNGEPIGAAVIGAPDDPLATYAGDHGAEIFRACIACHTLSPDEGNKAGPTLSGIFGRRIASLPGYNFSPALKKLDIVWTPETVAKLTRHGICDEYSLMAPPPHLYAHYEQDAKGIRQRAARHLERAA